MKNNLKLKLQIAQPFKICLIFTLVIGSLSLLSYGEITPQIPLFYSLANPEKQLVTKDWIFALTALSLLINIIHLGLINIFNQLDRFVLKFFSWSTLVLQIILLVITLRIILITI